MTPNVVEKGADRYNRDQAGPFDEKFMIPTNFGRIGDILPYSFEHPKKNEYEA